ncbi:MAG: hypothetical protein JXA77_11315 [Bacteroidales bacterium]|nr:hypothetical protein [Bacteroidales bacterium]
MAKIDDFKIELKALLDKYNASIACNIDGDTHCLMTNMEVEIDRKDYVLCNGCEVSSGDIKL